MAVSKALSLDFDLELDFFEHFNFKEEFILGRGMSGTVVLATSRDNPDVSTAVIQFGLYGDDASSSEERKEDWNKRMFMREVDIMKRLKHPNVMSLTSAIRCPSYLALVMPYCEGGSLERTFKYLDPVQVNNYFIQLTQAVEYLHSQRVFHGDIKPGNVLISSDDDVILTDYGLSKILPNHTVTIWVDFGTKAFRAPETFGDERVNPYKVDMYAVGVTFWSMVMKKKAYHWLDYLTELNQSSKPIPSSHRYIIRRLLDPNPDLRIEPSEILDEL